uniref:Uncharacterized protein n=1 Tax=Brassica oleracea TaxID=3712 RepID=A0A3P6FJG4_BRAOL|nr:unnamed protein product [Brassica oleracea]
MESITGATGDGDPATLPGDPITGAQTGDFMGVPATTMGDPIASELGDPSEPTEDPDVTSRDTAAPAKGSTHETDSLQSSTSLTTPPAVQGVGASETHDGGASSLALLTQSTDGGAASEVRDGGENRHKSMTGNHGEHSEGRDGAVETMPKEGNAMEHLIKDLEELSPIASSHEEKTSKISETSKELSKTIDVWVNGKGVKASGDVNGEKEFTISPSRFSPLQDIDEEEETCLEGSGTEVEEVEFRGNIVDGKKEKELQVTSTSRQQGSVPRQLRGRVTGSKDMSKGGYGGRHGSSKKTSGRKL